MQTPLKSSPWQPLLRAAEGGGGGGGEGKEESNLRRRKMQREEEVKALGIIRALISSDYRAGRLCVATTTPPPTGHQIGILYNFSFCLSSLKKDDIFLMDSSDHKLNIISFQIVC